MSQTEHVLTLARTELLKQGVGVNGLHYFSLKDADQWAFAFMPRHLLKQRNDPLQFSAGFAYPQMITYAYLTRASMSDDKEILVYKRVSKDPALEGMKSIGFGGHGDLEDLRNCYSEGNEDPTVTELLTQSTIRELHEELRVDVLDEGLSDLISNWILANVDEEVIENIGTVISSTGNQVGSVHIGFPLELEYDGSFPLDLNPTEVVSCEFVQLADLFEDVCNNPKSYEEWTRLIVEDLYSKIHNTIN